MNVRIFTSVSLLLFLATSSLCSIAKKDSMGGWPGVWPGNGGMPPLPPGGWPGPGGGSCSCSCNIPPPRAPKVFMVGDDKQWGFGATNYTEWALSNAPFYMGDILEFKYPAPVSGRLFNHSVYMLKNFESFQTCNLSEAVMIGDVFAGGEPDGFRLKLGPPNKFPFGWNQLISYFACGEKNGFHCKVGGMKFAVMPMFRGFP